VDFFGVVQVHSNIDSASCRLVKFISKQKHEHNHIHVHSCSSLLCVARTKQTGSLVLYIVLVLVYPLRRYFDFLKMFMNNDYCHIDGKSFVAEDQR
jgi:hypothetical protein